ncbi:hypothetical protein BV25DRAFT_1913898 [Artomyces pyxidatus]|uniref:Uncharacterized protein n=1 Tax=Artomyces pyxidatus TaxID=48021 RepID=A0ACB8T910_9AGAM|nr:hypothetical protein BV25DRAFT_1913898 [Artomyces pyxidatus]
MRVYALYDRNRYVLVFLILVAAMGVAVACWVVVTKGVDATEVITTAVPGCNQLLDNEGGQRLALAWSGVLVFDTSVFVLTLSKAFRLGLGSGGKLLKVLVRDGALYFTVLFLANLGNILMLLHAPPVLKDSSTTLTNVLSSTLVSRVMLNLRSTSSSPIVTPTRTTSVSYESLRARSSAPLTTMFDISLAGVANNSSGESSEGRQRYHDDIELVHLPAQWT